MAPQCQPKIGGILPSAIGSITVFGTPLIHEGPDSPGLTLNIVVDPRPKPP